MECEALGRLFEELDRFELGGSVAGDQAGFDVAANGLDKVGVKVRDDAA